jgi:enoyl-CoA hydratase/carnithine racemase
MLLSVDFSGPIGRITLARPEKRNALNDTLIAELHAAFIDMPEHVRVVILSGEGAHFCAGLDLSELKQRSVAQGISHSRSWHAAFDQVQLGRVPVIAVLHGAVVGGGLELASACHIRIAESSAFFGLPEGQRGLFVGGGGSARIPRLIGVARMADMMLTGRVYDAQGGVDVGFAQYLTPEGEGLAKALALAEKIAANAPLSNFAVIHALPRIADQSQSDGLFTESLMAAIAQGDQEAKQRMDAFLDGRATKVQKS